MKTQVIILVNLDSNLRHFILQACLGLEFDPDHREIRLRRPWLPDFLDEIALVNLSLDGASVDLTLRREGDEVSLCVGRKSGDVRVSIV